jgi:hypothetical protein
VGRGERAKRRRAQRAQLKLTTELFRGCRLRCRPAAVLSRIPGLGYTL